MATSRYIVVAQNGSPYSQKLKALLRYRRIPFDWVFRTERNRDLVADVRPQLLPTVRFPGESTWRVDTTPIVEALEGRHPERLVYPEAASHRFLALLLEDFADEWMPKAMFHYRWAYDADIDYASHWIADDTAPDRRGAERDRIAGEFAKRQIERMPLVGCTPANAPLIEASYRDVLALLEPHVGLHDYLFGSRPSVADFALYGQLLTLASDPTPQAVMRREAGRTESWLRQLDDVSGVDGEWHETLPEATRGLLELVVSIYLPFLAANEAADLHGQDRFTVELAGRPYSQAPFRYQRKCLEVLRAHFGGLDSASRREVEGALRSEHALAALSAP